MGKRNIKLFFWVIIGGILTLYIMVFANLNLTLSLIGFFIYLAITAVKLIHHYNFSKNYEKEKIKTASKKLSTDFTDVVLNYSDPIHRDLFKCKARIDDEGKIVCVVNLDYETEFENYEDFLDFFHFADN